MNENMISDEVLDKLEASLRAHLRVEAISRTKSVMHVVSGSDMFESGWLEVAMDEASLEEQEYNILLEYKTGVNSRALCGQCKFINYGYYFINERLAEKFGGCVSNGRYWILYDENANSLTGATYGYKGERLPTAEEITRYIDELCKEMHEA